MAIHLQSVRAARAGLFGLAVFFPCTICRGQQRADPSVIRSDDAATDTAVSNLRAAGLKALQYGDAKSAIDAADSMVRLNSKDPRTQRAAADLYLRGGRADLAVRLFDRYLQSRPDEMPYLWQRGIALYFDGDYRRGIEQFVEHRRVNANDVENAAWHFLCVAKASTPEQAAGQVLPAPGDRRVPMAEVHQMLLDGNTDAVRDRILETPEGTDQRRSAAFYGHLYLGLYADASGDAREAARWLSLAAENAPRNYMGDVARVYAERFAKATADGDAK
jgi:lipoprotein NlpI